jgi:LPS-assembly lipoprotein
MSWSDRRTLLLGALALGGCGFTPVYGPGGAAEGLRGRISFDDPFDRKGFDLLRQLENRLGVAADPRWRLSASIYMSEERIAVTGQGVTTRYQILGRVDYALREIGTDRTVASGTVDNLVSYSATSTAVATRAARADAEARLMVILADQIADELLATADRWS